jgi:hypothetical protein
MPTILRIWIVYDTGAGEPANKDKTRSVRKEGQRDRTSAIPLSKWVRHPKEGRFNSHRVNPRFPPSAPVKAAHACQCFLGSTQQGGM